MLLVARSSNELSMNRVAKVYESFETVEYIQNDFFAEEEAICCVWFENDVYYSALRLEPYADGMLLSGLETAPDSRRKGFGRKLLEATIGYAKANNISKIYSHISLRNRVSLHLHKTFGFKQILDYARFVDGTVSNNAVTLVLNIEK